MSMGMTRLSVNINKIATLRNARGGNVPDLLQVAKDCEQYGAQGITVHPRPDERHIRKMDVLDLAKQVQTELNIEGYPSKEYLDLIEKVKPAQATLVPDAPDVITSNAGWDLIQHEDFLKELILQIKSWGVRVSVFVEPNPETVSKAADIHADRIELYTEGYAHAYLQDRDKAIDPYIKTAQIAHEAGLGVNAGHDLSLENLRFLHQKIPFLKEVSIGHALICDALYYGLENCIQMYLAQLN